MPPKVDVDAWTTERVGPPESAQPAGRMQRFLAAWSSYSPPKSAEPGSFMIEPKMGERYAVDPHNLALKQGYESELVRYRSLFHTTWMVTVRPRGDKSRSFITDAETFLPGGGPLMPKSAGDFAAPRRPGTLFSSIEDKIGVEKPDA